MSFGPFYVSLLWSLILFTKVRATIRQPKRKNGLVPAFDVVAA
jgi:hypothetical protein